MHRAAVSAFAVVFMGIGLAMLVVTTVHGGRPAQSVTALRLNSFASASVK